VGLFEGDRTCSFCSKETETVQHIICCCEALARQRSNVFGNPVVEPKEEEEEEEESFRNEIRGKIVCLN
jgi:hypothetical protein